MSLVAQPSSLEQLSLIVLESCYSPFGIRFGPNPALLRVSLVEHPLIPSTGYLVYTCHIHYPIKREEIENSSLLREVKELVEGGHLSLENDPVVVGLDACRRNLTGRDPILLQLLYYQLFCINKRDNFFRILKILPQPALRESLHNIIFAAQFGEVDLDNKIRDEDLLSQVPTHQIHRNLSDLALAGVGVSHLDVKNAYGVEDVGFVPWV